MPAFLLHYPEPGYSGKIRRGMRSGIEVVVKTRRATERCRTDFESAMMRMSERMKLGPDTVSEVLKRVNFVNNFDNNIDWIVEYLEEDLRIKSEFLNSLSKNYSGIVSTNTSTLLMGLLALADYIGMDVCESIMKSLTQDTTFPYRNIPQALQRLLGNGHLGRKNRKGFFNYD